MYILPKLAGQWGVGLFEIQYVSFKDMNPLLGPTKLLRLERGVYTTLLIPICFQQYRNNAINRSIQISPRTMANNTPTAKCNTHTRCRQRRSYMTCSGQSLYSRLLQSSLAWNIIIKALCVRSGLQRYCTVYIYRALCPCSTSIMLVRSFFMRLELLFMLRLFS